MNLSAAEIAALDSGPPRIGVFFRLDTPTPVRLWMGIGKIEPGLNAIDLTGATYNGFGEITNVPEFSRLINGEAERVMFSLSGVSEEMLALATLEDAPIIRGTDCALGFALMGDDWQLLGAIKWVARYEADFVGVDESLTEDTEQPVVRTVSLSVGTPTTGRWRPGLSYWTDPDQQARSAGDLFCERTTKYQMEVTKTWPDF